MQIVRNLVAAQARIRRFAVGGFKMFAHVKLIKFFISFLFREHTRFAEGFFCVARAVESVVVQQNQLAVFGQMQIKFKHIGKKRIAFHTVAKCPQGVFRRNPRTGTVGGNHCFAVRHNIRISFFVAGFVRQQNRLDRVVVIVRNHKIKRSQRERQTAGCFQYRFYFHGNHL